MSIFFSHTYVYLKYINNNLYNNLLYYCTSISKISVYFKIIIIIIYFLVQLSAQLLYPHLFGVFHLRVFVLLLFLL